MADGTVVDSEELEIFLNDGITGFFFEHPGCLNDRQAHSMDDLVDPFPPGDFLVGHVEATHANGVDGSTYAG